MCLGIKYMCMLVLVSPRYICNYGEIFKISTGDLFQADNYLNTHKKKSNLLHKYFTLFKIIEKYFK